VSPPAGSAASTVTAVEGEGAFWDDARDLRAGLAEPVPRIPPRFGYDDRGAALFEEITRLPTYYLTRVERDLLRRDADDIAACLETDRLAELGSGSATKTALLLAACHRRRPTTYLPIDVTRPMLTDCARELTAALPGLRVHGLWGRYEAGLAWLRDHGSGPLVVAFLGSSLGNCTPAERSALLAAVSGCLRPGDGFLVSVDLRKPAEVLERCYNDPPGADAFARFRLNHLVHLNDRFDGDLDPAAFHPRAHYVEDTGMVEGHLYARWDVHGTLRGAGTRVVVRRGASLNVGYSAKFDLADFRAELAGHRLPARVEWVDSAAGYAVVLARRTAEPG
jgi:L-histidine N-alpha-methyltransferase